MTPQQTRERAAQIDEELNACSQLMQEHVWNLRGIIEQMYDRIHAKEICIQSLQDNQIKTDDLLRWRKTSEENPTEYKLQEGLWLGCEPDIQAVRLHPDGEWTNKRGDTVLPPNYWRPIGTMPGDE